MENSAPFVMKGADGRLTGFVVELFGLIAERMQRGIVFTTAEQPALFEGLAHGAYDLLPGPINATPDRASEMLLTEGYTWSEFRFGSRVAEPVTHLDDLHGRRLAVRSGSIYAEWAERNARRYGFTVLPTGSGIEAAQAVLAHEADASLSGSPVQAYAEWHEKGFAAGLALPETRTHESAAVRRADTELRDEVEDALRCLKLNGTVARLSKKWLGHEPDAEDLENLVVPGYGVPGLAGYDPKPKKARC
jgi:polar amino acid transport system substrate-binding protein